MGTIAIIVSISQDFLEGRESCPFLRLLSQENWFVSLLGVTFFDFTKSREWIFFWKMAEN